MIVLYHVAATIFKTIVLTDQHRSHGNNSGSFISSLLLYTSAYSDTETKIKAFRIMEYIICKCHTYQYTFFFVWCVPLNIDKGSRLSMPLTCACIHKYAVRDYECAVLSGALPAIFCTCVCAPRARV